MAQLTREDILKLARLARLQVTEDEIEHFQTEISSILQYVQHLQEADLDGFEPTYQVTGLTNATRPDEVVAYGATPTELLKNAPATEDGQIKVRRMLT